MQKSKFYSHVQLGNGSCADYIAFVIVLTWFISNNQNIQTHLVRLCTNQTDES